MVDLLSHAQEDERLGVAIEGRGSYVRDDEVHVDAVVRDSILADTSDLQLPARFAGRSRAAQEMDIAAMKQSWDIGTATRRERSEVAACMRPGRDDEPQGPVALANSGGTVGGGSVRANRLQGARGPAERFPQAVEVEQVHGQDHGRAGAPTRGRT